MSHFPIVNVEPGTPYQMGVQYGAQAVSQIHGGIADYKTLFAQTSTMSWAEICQYAVSYTPIVKAAYPELIDEVRGIADGAGVSFAEVMVLNTRYEITKFPKPHECTSFALLPEATAGGKAYVGQNWDYRVGIIDNIVIIHYTMPDGTRIVGCAEAGQVIRNGFNSHGIGLCANNLQSKGDNRGTALPVTFLRRKVLESSSFSAAKKLLLDTPRNVSNNFILGSVEGKALDFETSPLGTDLIEPTGGIVTHANHFMVDPSKEALEQSPRAARLFELLNERRGTIDVPWIIRCLSDHENYPKAICRHPADTSLPLARRSCTAAGIIYNLTDGVAHICKGPSCENEFVAVPL